MSENVKITFEVVMPKDIMIDEETLKDYYQNDWVKYFREFYEEEGAFWNNEELKLVKVEEV